MRVHAQQLSLLDLDVQSPAEVANQPMSGASSATLHHAKPRDTRATSASAPNGGAIMEEFAESVRGTVEPGMLVAEAARTAPRDGKCDPGHIEVPRHGRNDRSAWGDPACLLETIEKHYKTREVAEMLSVHEETVLRLAQCGNLRSVRVGSERRYAESAIREFLTRNVDESGNRLLVALRARR